MSEPYYDLGSYHRPIETTFAAGSGVVRPRDWCGPTRSTTKRRCTVSNARSNMMPIWPSPGGASPTPSARTTTRRGMRSTRSNSPPRWPGRGWNSAAGRAGGRRPSNAALIAALADPLPHRRPRRRRQRCSRGHARLRRAPWSAVAAEPTPDDVDVQALAADALLNVTAWALWDSSDRRARRPGSRVVEAKAHSRRRPCHPDRARAPRRAAPLSARDGDVGTPGGGAARGRSAARPGARRRPPAAHAQPHRRAVR